MLGHTPDSKNFRALQNARSIKDIEKVVTSISSNIQDMKSKPFQISLSSDDATVREVGDLTGGGTQGSGRSPSPFNVVYDTKINIPKSAKVDANEVNRFKEAIAELEAAKVVALSKEFSKLSSTKTLISAIDNTIKEARRAMNIKYKMMTDTAKENIPLQHKEVNKLVVYLTKRSLDEGNYTSIKSASYVVPDELLVSRGLLAATSVGDNVLFQTYVQIADLVDEENFMRDFYFVLTSRLEGNKLAFYLTSLKQKRVPGTFPLGERIENKSKLMKSIMAFLSVDNFVGQLDRKAVKLQTTDVATLKRIDGVTGARVNSTGDMIIVSLEALSKTELKKTAQDVLAISGSMLRAKKNSGQLRHSIKSKGAGTFVMEISLSSGSEKPEKMEMTMRRARMLGNALNLDEQMIRNLADNL